DPFCGSGTTGVVSGKYGRQFIGIDNNEEYLDIAKRRLDQIQEALEW
ncbi:DNA methyltransferase, partial [Enterocloster bolteae]